MMRDGGRRRLIRALAILAIGLAGMGHQRLALAEADAKAAVEEQADVKADAQAGDLDEVQTDAPSISPAEVKAETKAEIKAEDEVDDKAEAKAKEKTPPYVVISDSPKAFPWNGGEGKVVYRAYLKDVVDLGIGPYLERAIEAATEAGAAAIVVVIDTPGGRVDAAVSIKDLLINSPIPTIAFVNKQAISAGALIAFAHNYIVWSTGGTMGAATPIQLGAEGQAEPVEEKMTSYMRGIMRATAETNGRDPSVAEAMVDRTIDLPPYAPKEKLLTATYQEAEELGLLDGRADTFEELLETVGLQGAEVVDVEENWAESFVRLITHPTVSSILMSIGMLGLIIEFYTPGFGFAGIIGIASLAFFFGGHLIVNLAGMEEVILFLVGLILLAAEVLVIPGFGIAGVAGAVAIGASLIMALVGLDISIAWDLGLVGDALTQFAGSLVATGILTILLIRFLPEMKPISRLILGYSLSRDRGAVAGESAATDSGLVGKRGVALTDLRPVGRARIDGRKWDVSCYADYIAKGDGVVVKKVDGSTILVERLPVTNGDEDA